ncbi:MAG: exodeoxyribonuclease VII small subunit [Sulfuritalea sp.]|jgi:exodeoxyribonuclease VII small subunit|nr:exodeoxyribonuclease VII small subunit [Sulfuritalea sp.]
MATKPITAPDTDSATATAPSFENALNELEGIVAAMEAGRMPLQEALDAYKRGMALLRQCQETLSAAEQQIRILDANGLRDFDAQEEASAGDAAGGEQEG